MSQGLSRNVNRRHRKYAITRSLALAAGPVAASLLGAPAQAQNTPTWAGTATNTLWLSDSNWVPSPATYPGVIGDSTSNADVANFVPASASSSSNVVIDMSGSGANGALSIGALSLNQNTAHTSYLGNFTISNAATASGDLYLNGATIGSNSNVILSDNTPHKDPSTLTIQNYSATETLTLVLNNTTNNIEGGTGGASSEGSTILIDSNITEANAGSEITYNGNAASGDGGGLLELGGSNSYTGGTTLTGGGTIQFDTAAAMATTGDDQVQANGEFLYNASGTFGSSGQTLSLAGQGTNANSGAIRVSNSLNVDLLDQITIDPTYGAYITPTTSSTLTLSGGVTGSSVLTKQGAGTLVLGGTNSNFTGGLQINNGTVSVASDANLGSTSSPGQIYINYTTADPGTLEFTGSTTILSTRPIALGSGAGGSGVIQVTSGNTVNYAGSITGPGGAALIMTSDATNTGILQLNASNAYSGGTTINGGTLALGSAGSVQGGAIVNSLGTLAGSGTVNGTVTLNTGGTIAPGSASSAGVFTINGATDLSGGGSGTGAYDWKLAALSTSGAGTNFSQLAFGSGSAVTIGSASGLVVDCSLLSSSLQPGGGNAFWNSDQQWLILQNESGTTTGNFSSADITLLDGTTTQGTFSTVAGAGAQTGDIFLDFTPGATQLAWMGGSGNWTNATGTSWSGGTWDPTKTAVFNTGSGTVTLTDPITALGVRFDVGGYTVAGSGANTLNAPTIGVTNSGDTDTISAQLVASSLTKTGAGTLILTGANTYSGGTTVTAGTLQGNTTSLQGDIANSGTVVFDQATTGTYAGALSGSGNLIMQNSGTLILSNASNSYGGGTTINSGVLSVSSDANLGSDSGAVVLNGGTLQTTGAITSSRAFTVNATGGTLDTDGTGLATTGAATINGNLTVTDGQGTGTLALNGPVSIASTAALQIDANTSVSLGGTGTVNLYGNGATFNGNLIINGQPRVNFNVATFSGTGQIQVAANNSLITNLASTAGGTIDNNIVLNSTGLAFTAGNVSISPFTVGTFVTNIGGTTSGETLTINGVISGDSDLAIGNSTTGGGSGNLVLNNTNTYTGTTEINANASTITIGIDDALPITTDLIQGTQSGLGTAILDLNGHNIQVGSLSDGSNVTATAHNMTITDNGSAPSTLTVGSDSPNSTPATAFSGFIDNGNSQLNLVKIDSNTVQLSGSNTYSGGTTLSGGTLGVSADHNLGSTSGPVIFNGGTLAATNSMNNDHPITVNAIGGTIDVASGATLTVNSPAITWSGGTLNVTDAGELDFAQTAGTVSVATGSTLNNSATSTVSVDGTVDPFTDSSNPSNHVAIVNAGTVAINVNSAIGGITGSGTLNIGNGSTSNVVQLAANSVQGTQTAINVATGATLDITNNSIILTPAAGTQAAALANYLSLVQQGYNSGSWTGTGITSSAVAAANAVTPLYGIAVAEDDGSYGTVTGLASGQIEIAEAVIGDATLSGTVNFADFVKVEGNYGLTGADWDEGDFFYTGTVNFADFVAVEANFGDTNAISAPEMAAMQSFAGNFGDTLVANPDGVGFQVVSVPEPASAGLLALAGVGLLARRRRREAN